MLLRLLCHFQVSPNSWFGQQEPLTPRAPPEVKGGQFDYPFGANLNYVPRSEAGVSFEELRALADALPLLRAVIETRKDQIAAQNFTVRARARADLPDASSRIDAALEFLSMPDRRHSFADWLRMLLEDLLIDAATIFSRFDRSGALHSPDVVDGATIKLLIGEDDQRLDGRANGARRCGHSADGWSAASMSRSSSSILSQSGEGMAPVGAAPEGKRSVDAIGGLGQIGAPPARTMKFCAAIWSLRVSMTAFVGPLLRRAPLRRACQCQFTIFHINLVRF